MRHADLLILDPTTVGMSRLTPVNGAKALEGSSYVAFAKGRVWSLFSGIQFLAKVTLPATPEAAEHAGSRIARI